eukprot:765293-Hanusia_phi.AAC.1
MKQQWSPCTILLLLVFAALAHSDLVVTLQDRKYHRSRERASWTARLSFSVSIDLADLHGFQASHCLVEIRVNNSVVERLEIPLKASPYTHVFALSLPPYGTHETTFVWSLVSSIHEGFLTFSEQNLLLEPQCEFSSQTTPSTWDAWMERYAEFHSNVLRGVCAQRYLVFNATGRRGVGNRMITLTSTLLAALATNRAFLVWWEFPRRLREFLLPRAFEWDFLHLREAGFLRDIQTSAMISSDDDCEMLADINADLVVHSTAQLCPLCVFLHSINWFASSQVLSLVPEPRFYFLLGRTVSSLFSPSPALDRKLKAVWGQRKSCESVIVLQIRMPTSSTGAYPVIREPGERQIYRCAKKMASGTPGACFMIITDNRIVYPRAREELAGYRILLGKDEVIHSGLDHECSGGGEEEIFSRLLGSFADWYVMGDADDAILSDISSFGYSSYGRSMRLPVTVWNDDEAEDRCERRTWAFHDRPFLFVNTAERFFPPHPPLLAKPVAVHPFTHIPVCSSPGRQMSSSEERAVEVTVSVEDKTVSCRCRLNLSSLDDSRPLIVQLFFNDTLVFSSPLHNMMISEEVEKQFAVSLQFPYYGCFSVDVAVHVAFENHHVKEWFCVSREDHDKRLAPLVTVLQERSQEKLDRRKTLNFDPHMHDRTVEIHRNALLNSRRFLRWDFMAYKPTCLGVPAFLLIENCTTNHRRRQEWLRKVGFCNVYSYMDNKPGTAQGDEKCSEWSNESVLVEIHRQETNSKSLFLKLIEASALQDLGQLVILSDRTFPATDPSTIASSLKKAIEELPRTADLLLLAQCKEDCDLTEENKLTVVRARRPACARDFLLMPGGVRKILAFLPISSSWELSHVLTLLISSGALEAYLLREPVFLYSTSAGHLQSWISPCLQFDAVWQRTSNDHVLASYPSMLSHRYLSTIRKLPLPAVGQASNIFWLHSMTSVHPRAADIWSFSEEGEEEVGGRRIIVARSGSCTKALDRNISLNGLVGCDDGAVHAVEDRPVRKRFCFVISSAGEVDVEPLRSEEDSVVLLPGPASKLLVEELIESFSFPLVRFSFFIFCSRENIENLKCHRLATELEVNASSSELSFPSLFHISWKDISDFVRS